MLNRARPNQIFLGMFILINVILSAYIVYADSNGPVYCIIGKSCSEVRTSEYSSIMGIKLSWLGVISFSLLFLVYLLGYRYHWARLSYFIMAAVGAAFALYFIYLQSFVIGKFCSFCIAIDGIAVLILAISIYYSMRR